SGLPRNAATAARSRRYASTVRGERRAARSARNPSTSGSRMGVVIDAPEALRVDVAVHLRGRERAVAEELLNRAQVRSALEQVRGERVTEPVRVWHETPQRGGVEAAAAG